MSKNGNKGEWSEILVAIDCIINEGAKMVEIRGNRYNQENGDIMCYNKLTNIAIGPVVKDDLEALYKNIQKQLICKKPDFKLLLGSLKEKMFITDIGSGKNNKADIYIEFCK